MKPYRPETSGASMVTRYTLMSLTAEAAAATLILSILRRHVSGDRLILLILLYNILSVGLRALFSLLADNVSEKHTGVRLSVLLLVGGFVSPVALGVTLKVVLAAAGIAAFHAFAFSSVLARSDFRARYVGFPAAGAALGTFFSRAYPFFGYLAALLCLMLAIPGDSGDSRPVCLTHRLPRSPKVKWAPAAILLLLGAVTLGSYLVSSLPPVGNGWKMYLAIGAALAVGRAVGGLISDRIGVSATLAVALGGGTLLPILKPGSAPAALAALLLYSLAAAPLTALLFTLMPRFPGGAASLTAAAAYLGTVLSHFSPLAAGSRPIAAALLLITAAAVDLALLVASHRAAGKEAADHA